MVLTHFLLTRFSYDTARARTDTSVIHPPVAAANPLARRRLERRFTLFETFCVPSVLGQTVRDFIWVLMIDPRLEARDRDRLRELTSPHADTHLVTYDPTDDHGGLRWLRPYAKGVAPTHIVTTNIDDDDLIGIGVVESIQRRLRESAEQGSLPPCALVGIVNPPQWDFMPTRGAPLGHLKPWHRAGYPSGAAYTLCCRQPHYDLSVLALEHSVGAAYFDPAVTVGDAAQQRLRVSAERAGDDWRTWVPERHLHLLHSDLPQVIVVNHLENDQLTRLFEGWSGRRPVTSVADFPDMAVPYDRIPTVIRSFRRTPAMLVRYFGRHLRLLLSPRRMGLERRWLVLFSTLMLPIWFVTGMPGRRTPQSAS